LKFLPIRVSFILILIIWSCPVTFAASEEASGKFLGVKGCSTTDCHGGPVEKLEGRTLHNEFTTWMAKDKHAQSFANLVNRDSIKIAKSLGIAKTQESDRCMNCHSVFEAFKDESRRGKDFELSDGNSCDDCHGPAEKWLEPHAKTKPEHKSWTRQESLDAGMNDTLDLATRSELCVKCHLQIDHELLEAGHPKMIFEMDLYQSIMPPHWTEGESFDATRAWATGQVLGLREAVLQLAHRVQANADEKWIQHAHQISQGYNLTTAILVEKIDGNLGKSIAAAMAEVGAAVAAGSPDMKRLKAAIDGGLSADLTTLSKKVAGTTFDASINGELMKAIAATTESVHEIGMSGGTLVALALDSLYRPWKSVKKPEKVAKKTAKNAIKTMLELVEKPENWDSNAFIESMVSFASTL